jgi:hypothetical protein
MDKRTNIQFKESFIFVYLSPIINYTMPKTVCSSLALYPTTMWHERRRPVSHRPLVHSEMENGNIISRQKLRYTLPPPLPTSSDRNKFGVEIT